MTTRTTATATDRLIVRTHPEVVAHVGQVIDVRDHGRLPDGVEVRAVEAGYAIAIRGETICEALDEQRARRIALRLANDPTLEDVAATSSTHATGRERRCADRDLLRTELKSTLDELWDRTRSA